MVYYNALTLLFVVSRFTFHECCCPYFDSAQFQDKRNSLNNRSACPNNYSDLDGNGQPIPYTGSSWCQIFAARAFCYNRCLPPDWRTDRYGSKIICENLMCGGNGTDPNNITFRCICDVIIPNQQNRITEFRSGIHYTWSMVEEQFDSICTGQNATDINHFDPFNEYTP